MIKMDACYWLFLTVVAALLMLVFGTAFGANIYIDVIDSEINTGILLPQTKCGIGYERRNNKGYNNINFEYKEDEGLLKYYMKEIENMDYFQVTGRKPLYEKNYLKSYWGVSYIIDFEERDSHIIGYLSADYGNLSLTYQTSLQYNIFVMEYNKLSMKEWYPSLEYYRVNNEVDWNIKLNYMF